MTEIVSFALHRKPTKAEQEFIGHDVPDVFTSEGEQVIYGKTYPKGTIFVRDNNPVDLRINHGST